MLLSAAIGARKAESAHAGIVSGEAMAKALGISRAAVLKRINSFRLREFKIEAIKGRGYRLDAWPDMTEEEMEALINPDAKAEVKFYESAESTNDLALQSALNGAAQWSVFIAGKQTKGRGRQGRRWESPSGVNIYMSVILRPAMQPRDSGLITLAAGVAAAGAIRDTTGLEARLKWPNDIMSESGRKIGGILLEMRSDPDSIIHAVAGIGLNVNMASMPAMVKDTATSLHLETGRRFRRAEIASAVINRLYDLMGMLDSGRRDAILGKWRAMNSTLGKSVSVARSGGAAVKGIAIDVDGDGCLMLKTPGGAIEKISSGDLIESGHKATRQ